MIYRGAGDVVTRGAEAGADSMFTPESPIGGSRLNIPQAKKEGSVMTPLYAVLMGIAALALVFSVCGLVVLWFSPRLRR